MKQIAICCLLALSFRSNAQVGIGVNPPNASSILDVTSTNKGFLPPRMTNGQRNNILAPVAGLVIYNITINELEFYNGSSWSSMSQIAATGMPFKKLYGSSGSDYIYDIKPTADGGFVTIGTAQNGNSGTILGTPGQSGTYDCWVMKFSVKGSLEWQSIYGGDGVDVGRSLLTTSDGGYMLAGYTSSGNSGTFSGVLNKGGNDFFLIKIDGTGAVQWKKLFGGTMNDNCLMLGKATDGYVLAGTSNSDNTGDLLGIPSNGATDGYIVKADLNGNILWQKLVGGTGFDGLVSGQVSADNSLVFAGYSNSSNTGTLLGVTNNGDTDAWILRLAANGSLVWQKLFGGNFFDEAGYISQTADNGFVFCGDVTSSNTGTLVGWMNNGGYDGWAGKVDQNGNLLWQRVAGGTANELWLYIQPHPDGGFIACGQTASSISGTINYTNVGGYDLWITRFDETGAIKWQRYIGGGSSEFCYSLMLLPGSNILLGAYTLSGVILDMTSNGVSDALLLKLDKFGNLF